MQIFEKAASQKLMDFAEYVGKIEAQGAVSVTVDGSSISDKGELQNIISKSISDRHAVIYAISLPEANSRAVHEAFSRVRKCKIGNRAYSKLNKLHNNPTRCIYVGSKLRNIYARLMQHFGYGHEKTYALNLSKWARGFGTIAIDVRYYSPDIGKEALIALENHWASILHPLFGRRGSV